MRAVQANDVKANFVGTGLHHRLATGTSKSYSFHLRNYLRKKKIGFLHAGAARRQGSTKFLADFQSIIVGVFGDSLAIPKSFHKSYDKLILARPSVPGAANWLGARPIWNQWIEGNPGFEVQFKRFRSWGFPLAVGSTSTGASSPINRRGDDGKFG